MENLKLMPGISVVIITYNEEKNIIRCINSVKGLADEIIVVDSFSEDMTPTICRELGVRFYSHEFEGYREQKNFATSLALNDYVLSLDADEALSDELYNNILKIKNNLIYDGYFFNRRNKYCGQWIKHSNWYPDRKLRLFRKNRGKWGGINPHDRYIVDPDCKTTRLKGDILHWALNSYEDHIEKVNKFTSIAAMEYFRMGRKTSVMSMMLHGIWRFFKTYFMRRGFLDGYNGFVISSLSAYTSFLKYLKLRQLYIEYQRNKNETVKEPDMLVLENRMNDTEKVGLAVNKLSNKRIS
ncbi:MAG TPA: glycosyltransferase family 2 protein [Bacteroidales bacterium]|nr:glycosyltransferase family 2 protein [Bacteroidales bacterium]